jgi:hypothetical protein
MWKGLNKRELIASSIIGLLGAAAGGFLGYSLQYVAPFMSRPLSEVVPYSLSAGIISGFICCYYFSTVYLKKIRGDIGKKHFAYGWLYGIYAGAASGVIVAVFYMIGLCLAPVTGFSFEADILGPIIFMLVLSIILGAFIGAVTGLAVSIIISLAFGLWILKRLA